MEKITYTITEAADALGLSRPTIYKLLRAPGFPAVRIGGRWLIPKDALTDWLLNQCNQIKG